MAYLTSSRGIARNPQILNLLKANSVRLLSSMRAQKDVRSDDIFVGWGYKSTAEIARKLAAKTGCAYWAIEDGFISWLGHPVQSKPYQRLSYIVDKHGMYYDASQPSGIDVLLDQAQGVDSLRTERLLGQLLNLKVSKYNHPRSSKMDTTYHQLTDYVLLVDQTVGDASIECSSGSEDSFQTMLNWAVAQLKDDEQLQCIIKTHPDVILGKKKGYLVDLLKRGIAEGLLKRIHLLSDDISPFDLIKDAKSVATVSSQLGFEALWQNKAVHCFAWPFYAGRGLTRDHCSTPLTYDRKQVPLYDLVYAALIQYPTYLHPDHGYECEIEDIVDYLDAHFATRQWHCEYLSIPNISLWKRSFIPEFIAQSAKKLGFSLNQKTSQILLWGMKQPDIKQCWRIEDGFIRSVGLGADLRRPNSLVLDDLGIYYNGKQPSRLEALLNSYELNTYEQARAENLLSTLRSSHITKYNVESPQDVLSFKNSASGKPIILVIGQYQQDLSMEFGAVDIKDNLSLLKQVRSDFPDAYLIYKEHPDVYSGVRPGRLLEGDVLKIADEYVADVSLISLFDVVDRVCTICSLSGFEALMRGLMVTTYGLPFYGGWGLTDDRCEYPRRSRQLDVSTLVYVTLVRYSRYVNWHTRMITTVESTIHQINCERVHKMELKTNWFARQWRKMGYLTQAILKPHGTARRAGGVRS